MLFLLSQKGYSEMQRVPEDLESRRYTNVRLTN